MAAGSQSACERYQVVQRGCTIVELRPDSSAQPRRGGRSRFQAGALSTGQRRLVELARCLAGQFDVLILDEPSSGLDRSETEALGHILRRTVEERGCGILLVEHDMSLVMEICQHIYVLDFGELIFEGAPNEVAGSPIVQAAYLGAEATATDPAPA